MDKLPNKRGNNFKLLMRDDGFHKRKKKEIQYNWRVALFIQNPEIFIKPQLGLMNSSKLF